MVHDAGPATGPARTGMRRRFPDAQAVVFGHSHIPLHETAADGFQIFNPGLADGAPPAAAAHDGHRDDRGWKDHFRLD